MRMLNNYAGLGGNRKYLPDYVEVTAVEINPEIAEFYQSQYPNDTVIVGDAHEYLEEHIHDNWDYIWSSVPCPTHSKMALATRHKSAQRYPDWKLWQEIAFCEGRLRNSKTKYVIENVKPYYTPAWEPQIIDRHAIFSNFYIPKFEMERPKNFIDSISKQDLMDWLDIQMDKNIKYGNSHDDKQVLRNCCHPKTGLHIFNAAFDQADTSTINQLSLL